MNDDLSLSGTLGGLRIANPDDNETSPSPAEQDTTSSAGQDTFRPTITNDSAIGQPSPSLETGPRPIYHDAPQTATQYASSRPPTDSINHSAQPSPRNHRLSTGFYEPSRSRPSSAIYPGDNSYYRPQDSISRSASRGSNSSPYDPVDGRPINPRGPPSGQHISRQTSSSGGPNGNPSRRHSSRRSTGDAYSTESNLPRSSDAWQDKGAATSTRQEIDADGRPITKIVKKGVKDFNFGRTLGEGSYSTVLAAHDRHSGREYAVKVLDKRHIIKEKKVKYVSIEKDTLNRLTDHPGIVRLYYTFQDERSLYFVLDLATGGELLGVLKRMGTFDVECTRFYSAQILDSIAYMHSRGVIHRDLKPENVLLDSNMHTKITDFGTAKILDQPAKSGDAKSDLDPTNPAAAAAAAAAATAESSGRAVSFVGTAEYVSPELLTEKNACKASDLWAFGCIVYQLLAGRPPFKAGNEYQTFQKIVALDYHFPDGFPPVARDLVTRLLVLDPTQRLDINRIREHDFFQDISWGKGLWKQKAPKLRSYVPPDPVPIKLNDSGAVLPQIQQPPGSSGQAAINGRNAKRAFTELPPPSQLDIDWSAVLTRPNERILKLGNLDVTAAAGPYVADGKPSENESSRKFSRLFSSGANKKKQRLVIITSTARILVAAAGNDDKKVKLEIPLEYDTTYKSYQDSRGLTAFCIETRDKHYIFEDPRATTSDPDGSKYSTQEWIESFERAQELAQAQTQAAAAASYDGEASYTDMGSSLSSPVVSSQPDAGFSQPGEGRQHHLRSTLRKPEGDSDSLKTKKHRFSKRHSKSGLAAVF